MVCDARVGMLNDSDLNYKKSLRNVIVSITRFEKYAFAFTQVRMHLVGRRKQADYYALNGFITEAAFCVIRGPGKHSIRRPILNVN